MSIIEKSYNGNKYALECHDTIMNHFTNKGWQIIKSSFQEDRNMGIDYFVTDPIENKVYKVDMKNTKNLYVLNFNLDKQMVYGRKPFSKHNKASHLFLLNTMSLVPIREHVGNYISDIKGFMSVIYLIEDKSIEDVRILLNAKSVDQSCLLIKNMMKPYIKSGYAINYSKDKFSEQNKISFKIYEV